MNVKFFKIRRKGILSLHAVNGNIQLMVIPQQDDKKKGEVSLGDADFYDEMYEDELREPISEMEFLMAAGDITAGIQNFFSKLREVA